MRTLLSMVLTAGLLCAVGVNQAQASAMILEFTGGATGTAGTDPTCAADPRCVVANASDTLSFDIFISADAQGVGAYGFTAQWDSDLEDELDLITADEPRATMANAFTEDIQSTDGVTGLSHLSVGFGTAPTESTLANAGRQSSFEAAAALPFPNGIVNETFLVGILRFHVKSPVGSSGIDVEVGFFDTAADTLGTTAAVPFTPDFTSASYSVGGPASVPEPTTAIMMGLGLLGLLYTGRRSR